MAVDAPLELECFAAGVPPPTLSWLKDGQPLKGTHVVQQDGRFVRIGRVQVNRRVEPPSLSTHVGHACCNQLSSVSEGGRRGSVHLPGQQLGWGGRTEPLGQSSR